MSYLNGYNDGLNKEHNTNVEETIVFHRARFRNIIFNRLLEILPQLINYSNKSQLSVDFLTLELNLRNGVNVCIGMQTNGEIGIIGYTNAYQKSINTHLLTDKRVLTKKDINFTIPNNLICENYLELNTYDNYKNGNFIVMKNKFYSRATDIEIIYHYVDELAEIVVTRMSLIIQGKFSKIFLSEVNDETINQLIAKLHNGSPFIKLGDDFSVNDQIQDLTSPVQVQMLAELKREYQNKINEFLTFFGVDNVGIDKQSGVSNAEVSSNNPFTNVNANVYLKGREPIKHLCKRYGLKPIIPYLSPNILVDFGDNGGDNNEHVYNND